MENLKKWYKSRTVWSGIFKILSGVCASLSAFLILDMDFQTLISGFLASAWGIYDIIIRFQTKDTIK
jgi:hypothetical protein